MKISINRPCIICGSQESTLLFETFYKNHNYPGKFSLYKCNDCGLLFNSPRLEDRELFHLYNDDYYFFQTRQDIEFKRVINVYLRTIALIEDKVKSRKVLEIGSAKGYLLAVLKSLNWEVLGIEITKVASEFANKKLEVPTFNGTLEDFLMSEHKKNFPVVLILDVIEHVPDPINFLKNVNKVVEDGGFIIIDTPNGYSKNIDHLNKKWDAFNPFHIYFFSSNILENLLVNMGYTIVKSFSYNNEVKKFNFTWYLKKLLEKIYLFKITKKIYRIINNINQQPEIDLNRQKIQTLRTIQSSSNYFLSDDSKKELYYSNRGDNIVIIASKLNYVKAKRN